MKKKTGWLIGILCSFFGITFGFIGGTILSNFTHNSTSNDNNHDDDGAFVAASKAMSPFNTFINEDHSVTIIIVISLIGLTAIGGYFFLRRKKEA